VEWGGRWKTPAHLCGEVEIRMPRRTDIRSILVIGSGPIVIGQAAEFDYSGTQALKVLRREGYRVILVNSNPATIMTDPEMADATYIEPLVPEILERIIARERPDALLPTLGGQTALNLAMALHEQGVLERYGVELIGASPQAIRIAEDRLAFKEAMEKAGLEVPRSLLARSVEEALAFAEQVGYPVLIRPSFTLGGTGAGVARSREELMDRVDLALRLSPVGSALIEESLLGWKEFELEVMRDRHDNFVVVCSIENLDPMGIHTGDSITLAPAQTLTDKEYQRMRDWARAVMHAVGVETGGSNVQFAVNPRDGRMRVIEMNPRVSRSSALASKATGFPIAKIAALLAVGYTLDELRNEITRRTVAAFEPAIDYVVVKIPRWAFEKFPGADPTLGPQMKSVGEVMAIGRTFKEALQKAMRGLEIGAKGFEGFPPERRPSDLRAALACPNPDRLRAVHDALMAGMPVQEVAALTGYDPWFVVQMAELVERERELRRYTLATVPASLLRQAKREGFSDAQLAAFFGCTEEAVRRRREALGIRPRYAQVDTCAAEFEAYTPYLYSTYEESDEAPPTDRPKVVIVGSGPNRIGQGIEFDYSCCQAAFALRELGIESIMVNSNPETVSTDYDTSDRLYFEPLTLEDVLNIVERERPLGVIVQFGGQTALNLTMPLHRAGVPILGTSPDAIDLAEDRGRFSALLRDLDIPQPEHGTATSVEEALEVARRIGYPVLVRPSYVLGGRAMAICYDEETLKAYMAEAVWVSPERPVLIDRFLEDAYEAEVDAVADGKRVVIGGHPPAYRGSRGALRRFRLRAAALQDLPLSPPDHRGIHRADRPGPGGARADQHPVRDQGRHRLRPGGQPAGLPHRTLHQQSHRGSPGPHRHPGDAGAVLRGDRLHPFAGGPGVLREGGGPSVPQAAGRGCHPGPRDEIHRRGDGLGGDLRPRFRQGGDGRWGRPASPRDGVALCERLR